MANFDGYGDREEVVVDGFGGLNRLGPLCGGRDCYELCNFRPMADGTLERREGFVPFKRFEGNIRGVLSTERGGVREMYVVAGTSVYFMTEEGKETVIGQVADGADKVRFFSQDGRILLLDGHSMQVLTSTGCTPLKPYVPLYGQAWGVGHSDCGYPVLEKPNLLTHQLRLNYIAQEDCDYLYTRDMDVVSVDEVYLNGAAYTGRWYFNQSEQYLSLDDRMLYGTEIDMVVTVSDAFLGTPPMLSGAANTATVGRAEEQRMLLFGGALPVGRVYMSRPVDRVLLETAREHDADMSALYITEDDVMTIGDGLSPITGACRHYDRSLIFTVGQTWMADGSQDAQGRMRVIPVNTTLGCTAVGGCGVLGNSPVTVFGRRVLCWNSETDERDECNADTVSAKVEPLFPADFGQGYEVFVDRWRGEVWFYRPEAQRRIFILREQDKVWTSFDGFSPRGMVELFDRIGFFAENTLFVFDGQATCDTDAEGQTHAIAAEYMSQYLDFGHAGRQKRICGATVMAECGSMALTLRFHTVKGRSVDIPLRGDGDELSVLQVRGRGGRFRYLRAGIRCADVGHLRLHGMRLVSRP